MTGRFLSFIVFASVISMSLACSQSSTDADSATTAPVMIAAREGKADVVRALLSSNDVNVNLTDGQGNTPLIEAARFGHDEVVRALIERGADWRAKNKEGHTALTLAVRNGHDDVVRRLREAGAKE